VHKEEKIIAVGDIHGCCRSVSALLDKLSGYDDYLLLFVGDYIDRGPCSREVVELMLELDQERECIFLRGNHEQMLLDAVDRNRAGLWLHNGGDTTLRSYQLDAGNMDFPEPHLEFFRNTKLYYETENYFFVHAGIPAHQTISQSLADPESLKEFLWTRDHINSIETPWEKKVIFGHTPRTIPIERENMIGIDTGCVYSSLGYGKLTALLLPEEKIIQQFSLDND
jgi:serine/threonine protein phosphatase 1